MGGLGYFLFCGEQRTPCLVDRNLFATTIMKIIVAGGSGFIGSALVRSLSADGHEIIVLSRMVRSANLPDDVTTVEWDGQTVGRWVESVEGARAVFNLCGATVATRWTPAVKREIRTSRLIPTQALVQAIQKTSRSPNVLIQASAVGYYGACGDEIITEDSPPGSGFLAETCIEWEQAAMEAEQASTRVCRMRLGVVLGKDGGALPKMIAPFKLFVGGTVGDGKQWFPWVHLHDVIGAMRFVMNQETASGAFNTTAPNPLTMRDFARVLGGVLRRPSSFYVPGFALRMMFGEGASALLSGQRAVPKRLTEEGYAFQYPSATDALRNLLG